MATDDGQSRLLKTVLATIVVMLVGLLVVPSITRWNNRQVALRLLEKIETIDDHSVKVPLRQLDSLGDQAIDPLVSAAASTRIAVATIARQILEERLATLLETAKTTQDGLLDKDSIRTAQGLSAALARHIREFGPAGKQWAEGIALTMIELTDKLPARQTPGMLENCSDVLAQVPARGNNIRSLATTAPAVSDRLLDQLETQVPPLESLTRASEKSLEHLARIQPRYPVEKQPSEPTLQQIPRPVPKSTSTTVVEPSQTPLEWMRQPQEAPTEQPLAAQAMDEAQPLSAAQQPVPSTKPVSSQVIDIPTPDSMAAQAESLRSVGTEALFLRLRNAKFYEAGVIRSVLIERGMVEAEIDLRLRLDAPQPSDRLRYLEEVSSLPINSARRTLLWLLTDESGDVRLRALTALATTKHPEVSRIARELAVNDEDPRVANLAAQLIR